VAPKSKPISNYRKIVFMPVDEITFLHQINVLFKYYNIIIWY